MSNHFVRMQTGTIFILLILCLTIVAGIVPPKSIRPWSFWSRRVTVTTKVFPIKPPLVTNDSHLLEFFIDTPDCRIMEPIVNRLEDDIKTEVKRINIHKCAANMKLFEAVGGMECGTVPFFYNRQTTREVCGKTNYPNLKKWGTGNPFVKFESRLIMPRSKGRSKEKKFSVFGEEKQTGIIGYLLQRLWDKENK